MRALTYCSFADDTRCLGIVILEGALDPLQAAKRAGELGVNPGGELLAVSCNDEEPDVPMHLFDLMAANTHRLIPVEEARVLFKARSIRAWQAN
jgi:hypothetical protein